MGFEVYPQKRDPREGEPAERQPTGEHGWRFRDTNGAITGVGGEGFTTADHAERAVHTFVEAVTTELYPGSPTSSAEVAEKLEVRRVAD